MKNIYLAGGCFWCISDVFMMKPGVVDVISGYSGGDELNPKYEDVKAQKTNHRETINVIYDENIISFEEIINIFYNNIDPFDDGGQFIDRGRSYTLAFYYTNDREKEYLMNFIKNKEIKENKKIYISIEKFKSFYNAEEYHQHYSEKNVEAFAQELISSGRLKR